MEIETLIAKCETLDYDNDGPVAEAEKRDKKRPWLSNKHKKTHLDELRQFLQEAATSDLIVNGNLLNKFLSSLERTRSTVCFDTCGDQTNVNSSHTRA